jgi:hypothetical protein
MLNRKNTGNCNSGYFKSSDCNSGNCNSGKFNPGARNLGDFNLGNRNSGDFNSGNRNSGNCNSGSFNSGNFNSGNFNSSSFNSGNCNSGARNSGNFNSGYFNSGNCNSGNFNSGNKNSGYFNSGNYNSGSFNTNEPKMRLFNKDLDMTVSEFYKKYSLYMDLPLTKWVCQEDMTDEEKKEVSCWETMGGYLKTLDFKEACRIWWAENEKQHKRFLTLPGFDAEIFFEITGIDVREKEETVEIAGKKYNKAEFEQAIKDLKEVK